MRDLWRLVEAIKNKKHMVRIAFFPGGSLNIAVYDSEKQMKQKMYDAHSFEELETMIKKDWGHLLTPALPSLPPLPALPRL